MLIVLWMVDASDADIAPTALEHKGSSMTSMMQGNDVALPQSRTTLWTGDVLHDAASLGAGLMPPNPVRHIVLEAVAAKTVRASGERWIMNHAVA